MKKRRIIFILIILCITVSLINPICKLCMKSLYPLRYDDLIIKYSEKYNLDEYLVMALIKAESNYIYDANSGVANGLMQITNDTAQWIAKEMKLNFSKTDITDPETNINMGCFYLSYLLEYYNGNETLALSAYNAGMGNVNKWLSNKKYSKDSVTLDKIPFEETQKYINKIEKSKEIYINLYKNKEE